MAHQLAGLEEWGALHEDLRDRIRGATMSTDGVDLGDILTEIREIRRVMETSR